MTTSATWKTRGAVLAGALLLAVAGVACGSGSAGSGITLPSISTTTTTADSSTTSESTSTTRPASTSTTNGGSSTTGSTETTLEPTTTTTEARTTTTTEASTTTESKSTTTEVAAAIGDSTDSSSSPWLWVAAVALIVLAALIALFAVLRSRKATKARWLQGARDVTYRSTQVARLLDEAAVVLAGPAGADRQVWLDSAETLNGLAASTAALIPDAPSVPGEPEGTNSLKTGLENLRSNLTVCRSAAIEAERTRFELVGPTTEQLEFASQSVRQASAAVVSDAHGVNAALDRVDPPATPR